MSAKDLQREPHEIDVNWWWYEKKGGMCIVYSREDEQGCSVTTIPWRSIRAALKRLDK